MTVQRKIKFHPYVINYFKELLFYDIYIEHPKIKRFKNIDLLSELLFYEDCDSISRIFITIIQVFFVSTV